MSKHFIIQRKVLISMLFIATTMLGIISYKQLKMEVFPNAELPMLYVQVNSRLDVTPEYMEQKAIIPVESAVAALENIEQIESSAGRRRGTVLISYENRTNLKYAYLKLDERIAMLRGELPEEFTLKVVKVDLDSKSNILMNLQALGSGGIDRLRNFVDQHITPELENIEGVANVNVYGGRQKSVDIILDRAACDAYNITPSRVRTVLSRNMNLRQYGGLIKEEGKRFFVYLNAEYEHITQIENLHVGRGSNPVQLKDIAEIFYGEKEPETISRTNGMDAISIQVINDAQANIIDLSHVIRAQIEKLNKENKLFDIEIMIQDDTAESMENNINQIINLALLGGLLAVFILWVFLRNIRLVVVVAVAIPISIYTAFNFFFGFDVSINSLTLMGIALAVGMLLDTSVVVLENIYRLRSLGMGATESVLTGTKEVWRAILAATLTTIVVFVPFIFSSNYLIQLLGKHIGVSIISTLIVSLCVSLLLIPMVVNVIIVRSKRLKREVYQELTIKSSGIKIYLSLLKTAIRNPGPTIIAVLFLFFVTIIISMSVSVNKKSDLEADRITVYVTTSTGSTLEKTDKVVAQMEEALSAISEKKELISRIEEEEATITIVLQEDYKEINKRSFGEIQDEIYELVKDIPDSDVEFSASSGGGSSRGGGGGGGAVGFQSLMGIGEDEEYLVLKGQDFDLMVEVAEDVEDYLEELDNIRNVRLSVRDNSREVHLNFNSLLMSEYKVTLGQVLGELNAFENEISSGVNFRHDNEEYEIMLKYDDSDEEEDQDKTIEDLRELEIPDTEDESMHELQNFSAVYFSRGMREIERINQEKQVELRYSYNDEVYDSKDLLEFARTEIEDVIENANIPVGVAAELVQEENELDEFKYMFLIAFLLVYMILAALFESFITPFVVLLSIPLAAIGSFFLLTVTGNSLFNANTLMGFLILLGVVVNNAIILIDYMNILRKKGYRKNRAIMMGGMSRVRPILITTVTTCVAMLPLALGNAEYVKVIGPPFAITVIGGLSVSTLLTLVFIPMLYNGTEQALTWVKGLKLSVLIGILILEALGITMVILRIDSLIWKIGGVLLVFMGIPLAYWFISNSLRKAQERIISNEDVLHIQISKLVKIYGRGSKTSREFAAGRRMSKITKSLQKALKPKLESLIWQLPLLAFLVYFSWFYLLSGLWQLISSIAVYYYILLIINSFRKSISHKWLSVFENIIRNISPLIVLIIFQIKWENTALILVVGVLWYLIIAIRHASILINKKGFDIKKVRKVFRLFVRFVKIIPGVGVKREQFKALKGVSLDIGTGMFGLLGPNGAGKSTMIRIICGILDQSYGKIWINGIDTQEKREELQGLIGYLPQEFGMYENMSAEAYLDYQAILKGITNVDERMNRTREVLESVHMWEHRKKKIGAYSGGMKQRIGIAQVLLHLPRILVVDEPTAGLDPRERIRFRNLLVELSRSRIVIFSTHIIEDISSSCTTMAVINRGEVLFNGTPREMTDIASGKVWKAELPAKEFEKETKNLLVIHHMRDGDQIRARCISDEKPFPDSVEESPLLEDAYLWLLQTSKKQVN